MSKLVQNFMASNIVQQAQERHLLTLAVRQHLPQQCKDHCWVGNYLSGALILLTDDAVFFTTLRLQEETLKTDLAKTAHFRDITSIKFRVHPGCTPPIEQHTPRHINTPSRSTRKLFTSLLGTITDPELRKTLKRLAHK